MFENIFHAYDVRGTYPDQVNEKAFKRIAQAYASFVKPKVVAVGRDVRLSSDSLQKAIIDGLVEVGVKVADIGPVPTDMLYFAVGYYEFDGGIQVTASHNPKEFNGLKLVRSGVEAITSDNGLQEIRRLAESDQNLVIDTDGEKHFKDIHEDYLDFMTKFAAFETSRPLKVVANNNFGLSGLMAKNLLERLSTHHVGLVELNFKPDGNFPKGQPDPLLKANGQETSELVRESDADFGVAWDADGDRCFFVDETGQFISGALVTALFAGELLAQHPGEKIIHDIRNVWAIDETVRAQGGVPLVEKVGHGFMKTRMRQEDALFAGELSGHYYFRDFFGVDNGLLPFLLFLNIVARHDGPVSNLFGSLVEKYPSSGEINFKLTDKTNALDQIEQQYASGTIDRSDGISVTFDSWRFNVRPSNNENLLRLNVEAKDATTLASKRAELTDFLNKF